MSEACFQWGEEGLHAVLVGPVQKQNARGCELLSLEVLSAVRGVNGDVVIDAVAVLARTRDRGTRASGRAKRGPNLLTSHFPTRGCA